MLFCLDSQGIKHQMKIDNQGAFYTDSFGKDHTVTSHAYYIDANGMQGILEIQGRHVLYRDSLGDSHRIMGNDEGIGYYYDA